MVMWDGPTANRLSRASARHFLCALFAIGAGAADSRAASPFAPAATRTLSEFGAAGRDGADDTAALTRAFAQADRFCLDGQGKSYRVTGTLQVQTSLCLKNATIVQTAVPFDTSRYITQRCPVVTDAAVVTDCGDSAVPESELPALRKSLNLRTLLIRPSQPNTFIKVNLVDVKVDRGRYAEAGSRKGAAAIWLENADQVDMNRVEITGYGKGFGLLITDSKNVTINDISIHDMIWAPYKGDQPLVQSEIMKIGWNSIPLREYRAANGQDIKESKFYGVRVQEGVTCGYIRASTDVVVNDARISRCGATFDTGFLPWQSDGFDIGAASTNVVLNRPHISQVGEGIDVIAGGPGVRNLVIKDPLISDVFAFGIKLGYNLSDAQIDGAHITRAGLIGIIVYGPVRNAAIRDARLDEMGLFERNGKPFQFTDTTSIGGIRLNKGPSGRPREFVYPNGVTIDRVSVINRQYPQAYYYGFINSGATNVHISNVTAIGFRTASETGFH